MASPWCHDGTILTPWQTPSLRPSTPKPLLTARFNSPALFSTARSPGDVFYYADEFNVSWHPTLRALWSPRGRQVMVPTPAQPTRRYGLGAVDWSAVAFAQIGIVS